MQKARAELHDLTLGEGIVLHAFDEKCAFQAESLDRFRELKNLYGLNLDSGASHKAIEADQAEVFRKGKRT